MAATRPSFSDCRSIGVVYIAYLFFCRAELDQAAGSERCITDEHHAAIPTTVEYGPHKCSQRICVKPASRIQPMQSAPV